MSDVKLEIPDIFVAEDFHDNWSGQWARWIADTANARFREIAEDWPIVSCTQMKESNLSSEHGPGWIGAEKTTRMHQVNATHIAFLALPQALKKAECEHIITVHLGTENSGTWYECRKCDKKLRAKWETI